VSRDLARVRARSSSARSGRAARFDILQNDVANRHSPITIVAAVTSKVDEELYPTEVAVRAREGGLSVDSVILLNQIRSIDKSRLVRRMGRLTTKTMMRVDRGLAVSLGLVKL
jgi:mRNA interferase MazF